MASSEVTTRDQEEFRKYLEMAGVLDVITKVLVQLYEEGNKPSNAMDFLKEHVDLAAGLGCTRVNAEALRVEVSDLRIRVAALKEDNQQLRAQLACYKLMEE